MVVVPIEKYNLKVGFLKSFYQLNAAKASAYYYDSLLVGLRNLQVEMFKAAHSLWVWKHNIGQNVSVRILVSFCGNIGVSKSVKRANNKKTVIIAVLSCRYKVRKRQLKSMVEVRLTSLTLRC